MDFTELSCRNFLDLYQPRLLVLLKGHANGLHANSVEIVKIGIGTVIGVGPFFIGLK
jgi:hypothetical protein